MSKESNKFEYEVAEILGHHGFWAHVCAKAADGSQPCDIIAINRKGKHLIDAKLCASGRFTLNRVEDNQLHSILWFKKRCNGMGWFAIKFQDDIYMVDSDYIEAMIEHGVKSFSKISDNFKLESWLNAFTDN